MLPRSALWLQLAALSFSPHTPYAQPEAEYPNSLVRGCLHGKLEPSFPIRVCNSEDAENATELGLCRPPEFDYLEIRIKCQVCTVLYEYYMGRHPWQATYLTNFSFGLSHIYVVAYLI
jgi:hypothetical protein